MKKKTALTLSVLLALTNAAYAKDLTDTAEEHAEVSYIVPFIVRSMRGK